MPSSEALNLQENMLAGMPSCFFCFLSLLFMQNRNGYIVQTDKDIHPFVGAKWNEKNMVEMF